MFSKDFQNYDFPLMGMVRIPEVKIDISEKIDLGLSKDSSNCDYLCALAYKKFLNKKYKLTKDKWKEYEERLKYELEIFEELGFIDYVLLCYKIILKMKEFGHYVDAGRGSCVASFVFSLLGITDVLDVLDKNLIFERFISKTRSKKQEINGITYLDGTMVCDVDLNVGTIRNEIVDWLKTIYDGKICKISAFSTLTGKILVKDVYKAINEVEECEAKRISDLIGKEHGSVIDIEEMTKQNKDFKIWSEGFPKTYQCCLELRELLRQVTSHASGYFISYNKLDGMVPLELNKDKELTLSYDMDNSSKLGIKLDLLGLTQNGILTEFFKDIKENPEDINLEDDKIIYDQFQTGHLLPYGLYQISADCAYRFSQKIKPKNLLELSDLNALARPGALDYIESYVDNTGKSPHKIFDNILKTTRNLFLYQEQLTQAIVAIGFSLDEAEICRRIVGKKKVKEVKEWEQKIKDKVKENKLPEELGDIVWKVLNDSASYSFNRGHSLGVSKLGALTVWAKYKYPLQFYKACLNAIKDLPNPIEEISLIQRELPFFNIKLLPPHILKSNNEFNIEGNDIRFAISSIKGISDKTLLKLKNFCHSYSNKLEIFEAANECGLNIAVTSNIIAVGAMDDYLTQNSRAKTMLELFTWNILTDREKIRVLQIGNKFNYNVIEILKYLSKPQEGSDKAFINNSRLETIRKKFLPYNNMYKNNSSNEELLNYCMEIEYLGFAYSNKLPNILNKVYSDIISISQVKNELDKTKVRFCGQIKDLEKKLSKNNKWYINAKIYDNDDYIWVKLMEKNFAKNMELNNGRELLEKDIIVVDGDKTGDMVFAERIVSQNIKILLKPEKKVDINKE